MIKFSVSYWFRMQISVFVPAAYPQQTLSASFPSPTFHLVLQTLSFITLTNQYVLYCFLTVTSRVWLGS